MPFAVAAFIAATFSSAQSQDSDSPPLRLTQPATPDGIGLYLPEKWGTIRFRVANPSAQGADGLVVAFFESEPQRQFARRMWVPPHTTREGWMPVLPPGGRQNARQAEIKSFLVQSSGAAEVLISQNEGEKQSGTPVSLQRRPAPVVAITDPDSPRSSEARAWLAALDAIQNARIGSAQTLELPPGPLPVRSEALEGTTGIVMLGNRIAHDPAGIRTVRDWVYAGGSLWIVLDLVSPDTVRLLLGDPFHSAMVDRVELSEVRFERAEGGTVNTPSREFDPPVEFVRVEPFGAEAIHQVNGWPCSLRQKLGRGQVVFTTLGISAWVGLPADAARLVKSTGTPTMELTEPFKELAELFFEPPDRSFPPPAQLEAMVTEQIGYEIPGRAWVMSVLFAFCGSLLVAGVWLMRRERLDQMLWVLPLAACLAATPLLTAAEFKRQGTRPTAAILELLEIDAERPEGTVTGLAAMYQPDPWTAPLSAERGALIRPLRNSDGRAPSGEEIRRMIWTDLDCVQWGNLSFPAGVSLADFQFLQPFEQRIEAHLRFGPEGIIGQIVAPRLEGPADAIVATSALRVVALRIKADGSFVARSDDVLAPGQYIAGGVLTDEQRRRQQVFSRIFDAKGSGSKYPATPRLLFWAEPLEIPVVLPKEMRQTGSALAAVPLQFERSPPGTRMNVPSPFFDCRAIPGPGNLGASVSFDNRSRQWQEQSRATDTWLRFQLPEEILPVEIEEATIVLDINAPLRTATLSTGRLNEMIPVVRSDNMVGRFTYRIDRASGLALDERGGLHARLEVGEVIADLPRGQEAGFLEKRWKVAALELEVTARSLERHGQGEP